MKTYLLPKILRRGCPTIVYIIKEPSVAFPGRNSYCLGVYHTLIEKDGYEGMGRENAGDHLVQITAELYKALLKESKRNHERYRPVKKKLPTECTS
jgi:hypothetical protein